jgi:uroporphyrinogen-III synthase
LRRPSVRSRLPLAGTRIAITRSRDKAERLRHLLAAQGAKVSEFPAIRTVPILRPTGWVRIIRRLADFHWIVFTSSTGVEAFFILLRRAGLCPRALAAARLAAIGPGTGAALRRAGCKPDIVPSSYVAEALVKAIGRVRGMRVLIPCAAMARSTLPRGLAGHGAEVTVLRLYRTLPDRLGLAAFNRAVLGESIDAVIFTSSSAVEAALHALGRFGRDKFKRNVRAFSIGPITSRALARFGVSLAAQARDYSLEGIIVALVRYYRKSK